jgi:phosphohistidine phosphatase
MNEPELNEKKTLILMRHAKSDWGDASKSDHDRTLNERGQRDAPRMARWLSEVGAVPDLVLCSSAARTRQTVELMTPQWDNLPTTTPSQSLYLATPDSILRTIVSDGCDAETLMVVAHNPGTAHLVYQLAGQSIEMPTAAIAIFSVQIPGWSKLNTSSPIELIQWTRPKAL